MQQIFAQKTEKLGLEVHNARFLIESFYIFLAFSFIEVSIIIFNLRIKTKWMSNLSVDFQMANVKIFKSNNL